MTTYNLFNGIVDAIIATVNANLTSLQVGGIEERAEDPAVMDKVRQFGGYAYIVPLAEGRDRMDVMQGGTKDMYHNFSCNVTAYFDYTKLAQSSKGVTSGLRQCRNNAFTLIDLFNGNDNQVGYGYVYRFELEQGYYLIEDRVIQTYNVKFFIRSLETE